MGIPFYRQRLVPGISASSDDAEEDDAGAVDLTSSDLELIEDPSQGIQTVGMRVQWASNPTGRYHYQRSYSICRR